MKKRKRVLIVDDDFWLLLSLRRLLERCDYEVHIASDVEGGMKKAQERRPHVVLVDLLLGYENGTELVWRLRGMVPGLPVVLISAKPGDEAARLAAIYGAAFLAKEDLHLLPYLLHQLFGKEG